MNETRHYRVGEFAHMAGVTVRALHVYDRAGLLRPARRTPSDHRLYRQEDLLRLQQILTLKHLGFTLEEIGALLRNPAYDVREALRLQKSAVDQEIARLQGASYALARTLDTLESAGQVDWSVVARIVRAFSESDRADWLRRHYPPETWAWLQERATQMPPELVKAGADAWADLYAGFRAVTQLPPEHPDVQALAARMVALVDAFTGGDTRIEAGLRSIYRAPDDMPALVREQYDPALQEFMGRAYDIYRQKGEKS